MNLNSIRDYRDLLDNKDIDAVIIATPDHWHCLQTVHACQAGKDIYVEKPVGKDIAECDIMVQAGQKYGRVIQAGQWQRSGQHWLDAVEFLQSVRLEISGWQNRGPTRDGCRLFRFGPIRLRPQVWITTCGSALRRSVHSIPTVSTLIFAGTGIMPEA